ncbi:MAG: hypothetical protein AAGC55_19140, partial [Myxococcota bacterium]
MDSCAHLLTITLHRPIVLSRRNEIVPPREPIWSSGRPDGSHASSGAQDERTNEQPHSQMRPGAAVHAANSPDLRVRLRLPKCGGYMQYRLEGNYAGYGVLFAGTAQFTKDQQIGLIDVQLTAEPVGLVPVVNRPITWQLYPDDDCQRPIMIATTSLELYFLVYDPSTWFDHG